MRTTVELPDPLYRELRAAAARRGMRGFSPLVTEALEAYLSAQVADRSLLAAVADARGSWTDVDVREWEGAREEAWASWASAQSSTPTY
jgi:hypothetical protein